MVKNMSARRVVAVEYGTGGNKELKKIVKDKGFEYIQNNFHYTLLEQILNTASNEYVISRENYWKEVLLSRKYLCLSRKRIIHYIVTA